MENHFERLPDECLGLILSKVKTGTPGDYRTMVRPVCKRFLKHVRASATHLSLVDPEACPELQGVALSVCALYGGLKSLSIDTSCFGLAKAVGLSTIRWEQLYVTQVNEWLDELGDGLFLLNESKLSLRQLGFEVGSKTCDSGTAVSSWTQIEDYLALLERGPLELYVRNLPMFSHEEIAGAAVVESLKLDMVCELFSLAIPYVFPSLEKLYILDRSGPGEKDGEEALGAILGEVTEDGDTFGDPWPEMLRLKELTYVAEHHQWAESETLAAEIFLCIALQAPNLASAQLLGMLHANVASRTLDSTIGSLCSLEKLEVLTLEIVGGDRLGSAQLECLVPLVQKNSLRKLIVRGLCKKQEERLRAAAKKDLYFKTVI